MSIEFVGIDPDTGKENCPAVWVDTDNADLLFQGYLGDIQTLARCAKDSPRPDTEAVIRVPRRMIPLIREACDRAERTDLP